MFGATMPKTTVDENKYALQSERKIWLPTQSQMSPPAGDAGFP
jgi:hypothetical protein